MLPLKEIVVGYEVPEISKNLTLKKMEVFARQVQNRLPIPEEIFRHQLGIHFDRDFARTQGLPKPIGQALHYFAYASELMVNFFGETWLKSGKLEMSFLKMVFSGDILKIRGVVTEIIGEGDKTKVVINISIKNQNNENVAVGMASNFI
jgi:hypothetical protein